MIFSRFEFSEGQQAISAGYSNEGALPATAVSVCPCYLKQTCNACLLLCFTVENNPSSILQWPWCSPSVHSLYMGSSPLEVGRQWERAVRDVSL